MQVSQHRSKSSLSRITYSPIARIALADAGDGIEDANFEEPLANASILRLFELRKWAEETLADNSLRTGELTFFDRLFENDFNGLTIDTRQNYEKYITSLLTSERWGC
jgi:leucyl-tRNA synthetase